MKKINLFYQYYDLLFKEKNYSTEVDKIISIVKKHQQQPLTKILEIGCGTGNHSFELIKHFKELVAIDIDKNMLDIAIKKQKSNKTDNIKFFYTPVEKISEFNFDLVLALFNVITYIPSMNDLHVFFEGVNKTLKKDGLFIFDCWNGIAAIKDPPASKSLKKISDNHTILCDLKSKTDFFNQKTLLEYNIKVSNSENKIIDSDIFQFEQTLWTPMEIKYFLEKSNLRILQCNKIFEDTPATENDWKIMFICAKN